MRGNWSSDQDLFAQALAAYSDACTIPTLTPGCPHYRLDEDGPSCNEECRNVLSQMGVDRPTATLTVLDGLVMTGVVRPIEIASATMPFDATEILLRELHEPLATSSTTTLLLRAHSFVSTPPSSRKASNDQFFEIWRALEQRQVPVAGILRQHAAPSIASQIVLRTIATDQAPWDEWVPLLQACKDAHPSGQEREASVEWLQARLTSWFGRLVDSDIVGFLEWRRPPEPLLVNVPPLDHEPEAGWIWDRFALTNLENWATTSLLLELKRCTDGSIGDHSERVLAARRVARDDVVKVLLTRLSEDAAQLTAPTQPLNSRDLSTQQFVDRAARHLRVGSPDEAAEIFTALAFMNPADGDALNNLGFCLIATAPEQALGPLDRASTLPLLEPNVNLANRAFVRHLLGRDAEALALLERADPGQASAHVWVERECRSFALSIQRLDEYIEELRVHLLGLVDGMTSSGPNCT